MNQSLSGSYHSQPKTEVYTRASDYRKIPPNDSNVGFQGKWAKKIQPAILLENSQNLYEKLNTTKRVSDQFQGSQLASRKYSGRMNKKQLDETKKTLSFNDILRKTRSCKTIDQQGELNRASTSGQTVHNSGKRLKSYESEFEPEKTGKSDMSKKKNCFMEYQALTNSALREAINRQNSKQISITSNHALQQESQISEFQDGSAAQEKERLLALRQSIDQRLKEISVGDATQMEEDSQMFQQTLNQSAGRFNTPLTNYREMRTIRSSLDSRKTQQSRMTNFTLETREHVLRSENRYPTSTENDSPLLKRKFSNRTDEPESKRLDAVDYSNSRDNELYEGGKDFTEIQNLKKKKMGSTVLPPKPKMKQDLGEKQTLNDFSPLSEKRPKYLSDNTNGSLLNPRSNLGSKLQLRDEDPDLLPNSALTSARLGEREEDYLDEQYNQSQLVDQEKDNEHEITLETSPSELEINNYISSHYEY